MAGNDILNAATISPQVLLSQQLGTTDAAVFTVPAATSVKLAQGSICNVSAAIAAPTLALGTTATTGGTFAAATYYWKVTAKSSGGETLPSNEVTATIAANGTQTLSWPAVPGAASYNVYRGTAAGAENVLVINTTATTYTDTGASNNAATVPTVAGYGFPITVYLSIVKAGGTIGDGTHRVIHGYSLQANDTLSLKDYLGGAMLGPGDAVAAFSSTGSAVDMVLTGTVHA